jgi:hypothetical protein
MPSVSRSGLKSVAQSLPHYVFSVGLPARGALRFGLCQSVARSGQKSIAQGLPWVNFLPELALKGPSNTARVGSEPLNGSRAHF